MNVYFWYAEEPQSPIKFSPAQNVVGSIRSHMFSELHKNQYCHIDFFWRIESK